MPATTTVRANGLNFHVEESGSGEPLVLIHGSWGATNRWELVVDDLAQSFHVVNNDRPGHGDSQGSAVPATRLEQEDDIAGIIEALGIGPAHLVGYSFGAVMALSLALRRPDLVRTVSAHEPPAAALDHPTVQAALGEIAEIGARIRAGDRHTTARDFVERVALGPGTWELLPVEVHEQMFAHADTFGGEMLDEDWPKVDSLTGIQCPVLVTYGDQSPAWFGPAIDGLRAEMPQAKFALIEGAGHIPHATHPDEYVEVLTRFVAPAPR